jgi:AraC family transcriptional regulator
LPIAKQYGKAFRKEFGYNPTTYIAIMSGWSDTHITTNEIGGYIMKPVKIMYINQDMND